MNTILIPGTITPDRVYQTFEFRELPADVQDRLINAAAMEPDYDWIGSMLTEDHETDISEYFIPEFMEPYGVTPETRTVQRMSGRTRQEPAIYWTDHYGWDVWFSARVDLETFILKSRLGTRFALLLSAARRGDVYSAEVGSEKEYRNPSAEIALNIPYWQTAETERLRLRIQRLESQARELESIILDWYQDVTQKMKSSFRSQADYYFSEEYYREEMENAEHSYLIDGSIFAS